jgi:hypothetical protein
VRAPGVEEKKAPRVFGGAEQALHARIDEHTAAGIAGADQMRVRIPDLRGIEPIPRRAHQLVLGKALRQPREAGIPQPLLGPEAPDGGAGRGEG